MTTACLVLALTLALTLMAPSQQSYPRSVVKTLEVGNGDRHGVWQNPQFCMTGYATAFELKVQHVQGEGDDTALNAIRLKCKDPWQWRWWRWNEHTGKVTSGEGPWGQWTGTTADCGRTFPIAAFRLRVDSVKVDQTGANNLKVACKSIAAYRWCSWCWHEEEGVGGRLGSWTRDWSWCDYGTFVCGLETRLQVPESEEDGGGDERALTDVHFFCCND